MNLLYLQRGKVLKVTKLNPKSRFYKLITVLEGEVLVTQSCLTLYNPRDCSLHQAPRSMGFSRQEYWSRLPFPSPGDLPDPGIEPRSPWVLYQSPCRFFTIWATREAPSNSTKKDTNKTSDENMFRINYINC